MPLLPPSRDDAFRARVQASATLGIAAAEGDAIGRVDAQTLEADMAVYAELNTILAREDLDNPASGMCVLCRSP
jgi:hypothetical protein